MIEFVALKNIFVRFSNRYILSDISFSLIPNRIVTLIGPNGAGKSTLIRVILGLIQPDLGSVIRFPGISIGYLPQKIHFNNLLPITVERFMQLSKRKKNVNILKVLQRVNAVSLQHLPLQKLSGGEIQRVLLAKALLNSPNLLILDEPLQGVDIIGQFDLYELINQIRSEIQCSIFIVSHDLNFVMAKTDHVICLNTHICCSGTPKKVFKSSEFISIFGLKRIRELAIYQHNHDHVH